MNICSPLKTKLRSGLRNLSVCKMPQNCMEAEERYLPRGAEDTSAIVLAASRGDELGELTEHATQNDGQNSGHSNPQPHC